MKRLFPEKNVFQFMFFNLMWNNMQLHLQEKINNGSESENKEAPSAETTEPKPESSVAEEAEVKTVTEDKATVAEEKKEEAPAAAPEKPEEAKKEEQSEAQKEEKKDAPAAATA